MANDRQLIVRVVSDTKSLERGLKRSETQLQKFGRTAGGIASAGGLSGGVFGLGRGGVIAAGAGAAVLGLRSVTGAAANAQQVLGQTRVALEDSGLSWDRYGKRVEAAADNLTNLGFDDEETLKVIAAFARGTGDVDKAIRLTSLSANVARGRYIDLAAAATIVGKANLGNAGALRRMNIDAKAGATSTQLLTLLQQKYGSAAEGAANDATTANERLRVTLGNVQEQIGSGLLPVVTQLSDNLAEAAGNAQLFVQELQGGGGGGIGGAVRNLLKNNDLRQLSDFITLIKGGHPVKAGESPSETLRKLREEAAAAKADIQGLADQWERLFGIASLTPEAPKPAPAFGQPGFKTVKAPAVPLGPTAAQRNQWFDAGITRQLDRVQDVKTIAGQVSSLQAIAAEIQKRIDATKDITRKLSLEDQLVAVQRQTRGLKEQQASDALARAQEAREKERLRRQAEIERRAAALQARSSRQARALGLSADGSEVVPQAANLRKQLASLTDRIGGSNLSLSSKLKAQLVGARKVLNGEFGEITRDSRSRIQELFATIRGEFDNGAKNGPLTKTTALSSERILAGLGLSADAERQLRARLSHFNSAGTSLSGAGSGSMAVTVTVPVTVDGKVIAKASAKYNSRYQKLNPSGRNGPNAGRYVGA